MFGKYDHLINKYRHRFFDDRFKNLEISFPEGPYLVKIHEKKSLKMNDLTSLVPYHKSHSTRAIQHLTDSKLIEKTIDPDDQRGFILKITADGQRVAKEVLKVFSDWDDLMYSVITEEEKALIESMQKRMYEKLVKLYGDKDTDE